MLKTALALATPVKMLNGLDAGRLRMHPTDYRAIAQGIRDRLDTLATGELIALARNAGDSALGELAEATVFDRAWCLVLGERHHRVETERQFDALMRRLRGQPAD